MLRSAYWVRVIIVLYLWLICDGVCPEDGMHEVIVDVQSVKSGKPQQTGRHCKQLIAGNVQHFQTPAQMSRHASYALQFNATTCPETDVGN